MSGAAELVFKFAERLNIEISLELAYIISHLVDGHPYYIWCLFHSRYQQRDLIAEEGMRKMLTFEVENKSGNINQFWMHHFLQHMEAFNLVLIKKFIAHHFKDQILAQYPYASMSR